jgi:GTP-binding protein
MKFIDSTQICIRAGKGGDGIVSFKSAKGKPKLGPDGGDGGTGGNVVLRGNPQLNTLSNLRYRAMYKAEDGVRGGPNCRRGACGDALVIDVPLGTVILDADTGAPLGEIVERESEVVVAKGGRHGLGNTHWASPTHQTPEEYRPGMPGEERELRLELKLLADVGFAGFPNAGKSTLLSRLSAARPKIADYPFTTLVPNLGVMELPGASPFERRAVVLADVPGLIEGASEGRGLGHQFLRHLERTSVIVYVIDAADFERDAATALDALRTELKRFSPGLAAKRAIVALNKIDCLDAEALATARAALAPAGLDVLALSGVTGAGLSELAYRLADLVDEERRAVVADA